MTMKTDKELLMEMMSDNKSGLHLRSQHLVPMVIENTGRGERGFDIFSRLLRDRIILISTPIDDAVAALVTAQLLYLEGDDSEKDIQLYINSPGGYVTAGLAIYDTIQFVKPAVSTICIGQCASMAALLLASGENGKRACLENSRVMIHQPWGGFQGQASDIQRHAEEIIRIKDRLNKILAKHTGQSLRVIEKDTDRDFFMDAEQAKGYGIVDAVYGGGK